MMSSQKLQSRFEQYITPEEVLTGLLTGTLLRGILRVNSQFVSDAFVSTESSSSHTSDVLIKGKWLRNRAIHGDSVIVRLLTDDEASCLAAEQSDESCEVEQDKTQTAYVYGKVVAIERSSWESRNFSCVIQANSKAGLTKNEVTPLSFVPSLGDSFVKAVPMDKRIPWILIRLDEATKKLIMTGGSVDSSVVYPVRILKWEKENSLPLGRLSGSPLGSVGHPDTESSVCMNDYELCAHEEAFSPKVEQEVEAIVKRSKGERDASRRDITKDRIFTIDPKTARDLDDAVSVHEASGGFMKFGVHIADVSHYVTPGSALDLCAKERCTSVYFPCRVYPMLPHALSNDLCSLNPNEVKMAFSTWFYVDVKTGELCTDLSDAQHAPTYAKSAIKTCCRLDYEQAQDIIDEGLGTHETLSVTNRPSVFNGYHYEEVRKDLLTMYSVCGKMREFRFGKLGSVSIDSQRMRFKLDDQDWPISYAFEEHSASHWLIEELMLAANRVVAVKIAASFPSAVIRYHEPPEEQKLVKLQQVARSCTGSKKFEAHTSSQLNASLQTVRSHSGSSDKAALISYTALRCMQLAVYNTSEPCMTEANQKRSDATKVTGSGADSEKPTVDYATAKEYNLLDYVKVAPGDGGMTERCRTHHYALGFDMYTHFTSPIRRYADIMVHRQLLAALVGTPGGGTPVLQSEDGTLEAQQGAVAALGTGSSHEDVYKQCMRCNDLKKRSREAQQKCETSFFIMYLVNRKAPEFASGSIMGIGEKFLKLFMPLLNQEVKVYYEVTKPRRYYDWFLSNPTLKALVEDVPRFTKLNQAGAAQKSQSPSPQVDVTLGDDADLEKDKSTSIEVLWKGAAQVQTAKMFDTLQVVIVPLHTIPIEFCAIILPPNFVRPCP